MVNRMICSPIGTTFHQGFPDRMTQSDSSLVSCLCSTTGELRPARIYLCSTEGPQAGSARLTRSRDAFYVLEQWTCSSHWVTFHPGGGLPGRKKELVIKTLYNESYYSHGRNLKYCLRVQFTW